MPGYYRRSFRSYRGGSRRFRRSSGSSAWALAKSAWKGVKFIRGIVNSELHVHDSNYNTAISTTAEINRLSGIAQGDDSVGRTGRSILAKSFQIRLHLQANASATQPSAVRFIVGIDMDANSTLPTEAEILDVATASNLVAMRELDNDRGRFRILVDKTFSLSIPSAGNGTLFFNKFIRLGNHHVYFDSTTNTSDAKGKLFFYIVSNQATNTVAKNFATRLRFYDN